MDTQFAGISSPEAALQEYDALLHATRTKFAASRGVPGITSPDIDSRTMAAFLLHSVR